MDNTSSAAQAMPVLPSEAALGGCVIPLKDHLCSRRIEISSDEQRAITALQTVANETIFALIPPGYMRSRLAQPFFHSRDQLVAFRSASDGSCVFAALRDPSGPLSSLCIFSAVAPTKEYLEMPIPDTEEYIGQSCQVAQFSNGGEHLWAAHGKSLDVYALPAEGRKKLTHLSRWKLSSDAKTILTLDPQNGDDASVIVIDANGSCSLLGVSTEAARGILRKEKVTPRAQFVERPPGTQLKFITEDRVRRLFCLTNQNNEVMICELLHVRDQLVLKAESKIEFPETVDYGCFHPSGAGVWIASRDGTLGFLDVNKGSVKWRSLSRINGGITSLSAGRSGALFIGKKLTTDKGLLGSTATSVISVLPDPLATIML